MTATLTRRQQRARRQYVIELGQALHQYGTPTHRLERALTQLATRLELQAQILSTPTSMTMAFGPMDNQQVTLLRVNPGGIDLEKLSALDALASDTLNQHISIKASRSMLQAIVKTPQRFGMGWQLLAGAAASGAVARFFGGSLIEISLSAGLGLAVVLLMVVGAKKETVARLIEPMAAVLAALATVCAACLWPLNINLVLIASLIVLVPGFSLTLAIRELATRHLVAGSARMFGATLVFFELGFGVILAQKLSQVLPILSPPIQAGAKPLWSEAMALMVSAFAFGIFFQAKPRDFGWVGLASVVAYTGASLTGGVLGPESGAFVGALGLGLISNTFARMKDRPASIMLVPGTILLVPGSVGLKSMSAIVGKDVLGGVEAGFAVMMIATAIVAGLLIADVVSPPRRSL